MKMKIKPKCLREEEYTVNELFNQRNEYNKPVTYEITGFFYYYGTQSQPFPQPEWIKPDIPNHYNLAKIFDTAFINTYGNRIVKKEIVNILKQICIKENVDWYVYLNPITSTDYASVNTVLRTFYDYLREPFSSYRWQLDKLYEIILADYDPIENYNMTENETETGNNDTDETTSTDTTGKTEYGKVIDNDRTIKEDTTNTGNSTITNSGTNISNIKTDNTQTTDANTTNAGTVTETTDRTNTIIGENSNLETIDTEKIINDNGDETRTDDLKEIIKTTGNNTRTDDLSENITENRDNTRTDNLKETLSSSDDNNKVINTTEIRTDALKEVFSKNDTNTETTNMQHQTEYNTSEKESNDLDISSDTDGTRTDNLTETTGRDETDKYGKTIKTDRGEDKDNEVKEGGTKTIKTDYSKVYTETTTDKNTDDKGNYYQEIVGDLEGSDPYIEKKITSGAYEDTTTYNHTRTEPQDRGYSDERKTTGERHTKNEQDTSTSAFNSNDYSPIQKIVSDETTDKYPIETTTHKPADGDYIITEKTTNGTKDTTKRTYSLPDGNGNVENYKETTEMLGKRLELRGGKTHEILHIDGDKELEIPSYDEETITNNLITKTTDNGTSYEYTKNEGQDEITENISKNNSGTVSNKEILSRTEDSHRTTDKTGTDTLKDSGTVINEASETNTKDNTGTVTNKIEGKEDELHTIESTKDNTGTSENKEVSTTGKINTGTITEDKEEDITKNNTGTVGTVTSNEQTTKDTGTIKNDENRNETQHDAGTVTSKQDISSTSVSTVTDDGTQKNTNTIDITQTGNTNNTINSNSTDKLKISQSGEDNITENIAGKRKELSTHDITRMLTRRGNIGVTTTQQMLQSQIDLWSEFSFVEIAIKFLANILTISVY